MLCQRQLRVAAMGGPYGLDLQAVAAVAQATQAGGLAVMLVASAIEPGMLEGLQEHPDRQGGGEGDSPSPPALET